MLIYFNNCAIYQNGQSGAFMVMEQPWLCAHFDRVMMAADQGADWLSGDTAAHHSPRKPFLCDVRALFGALFSKDVRIEWKRLFRDRKLTLVNLLKVLRFAARGRSMFMAADAFLPKEAASGPVTLYSCWLSFDGYAAALMKRKYPHMRMVARGHLFDIDAERIPQNPYYMKQAIAEAADGIYLISKRAMEQYMSYMQGRVEESKLHIHTFGSAGKALEQIQPPPRLQDGVLRIVSCSRVAPIKQIEVMIRALAQWEGMPVHWTHIGDGELLADMQKLAEELLDLKENVVVRWMGGLPAEEVVALYENQAFDVILNTSRMEGVPVSIMEAMRCGTPVIAPRVGGLPEQVTPETGWLYEPEEGPEGVCRCLRLLAEEDEEAAMQRRLACADRWYRYYRNEASLEAMLPEGMKE